MEQFVSYAIALLVGVLSGGYMFGMQCWSVQSWL